MRLSSRDLLEILSHYYREITKALEWHVKAKAIKHSRLAESPIILYYRMVE